MRRRLQHSPTAQEAEAYLSLNLASTVRIVVADLSGFTKHVDVQTVYSAWLFDAVKVTKSTGIDNDCYSYSS